MERNKKIIIAASITAVLLLLVSIAFAALASQLNISFGNVSQNALRWNVGFKGSSATATQEGTSNTGLSCGTATITPSTVAINDSTLSKPGDKCTYSLTIENKGDIAANLSAITMTQPVNMTCTKPDEATMECGNITIKLKTENGLDFSSGITINTGEEYNVSLIVSYTGESLNSETTVLKSIRTTFSYIQAVKRSIASRPDGIKSSTLCKRATTLHTEICTSNDYNYYCRDAGYKSGGKKGTTTIKYGNLGTNGILKSGDAFDCDVNGDGTYDSETERFYYVSQIDGNTSNEYAVLIYYTNVSGGVINNKGVSSYNSNNRNYEGPVTAYQQLPSVTQWSNVNLSNSKRQIYAEDGNSFVTYKSVQYDLPIFDYEGRAARFLSYKEINKSCNITAGTLTKGELDNCEYLLEHTRYVSSDNDGMDYWIENPRSTTVTGVWVGYGIVREVGLWSAVAKLGIRPVIEVHLSRINY